LFFMQAEKLLQLIPDKNLEFLASEINVDYQVKKIKGIVLFKLILFSMLNTQRVSLRVMEQFIHDASFKSFSGFSDTAKFNSIRDRIATVNAAFFEKIFLELFERFNRELKEEKAIVKVDSTFVTISAKLVNWSLRKGGNNAELRHLKLGLGLKGSLPCHVKVFTTVDASSDDIAIPETVLSCLNTKSSIVTFDRGVQSRKSFKQLHDANIIYVGRLNPTRNYKLIKSHPVNCPAAYGSIIIQEDITCQLKDRKGLWSSNHFRIIKAVITKSNEPIWFVTNDTKMSAFEIAAIYKQRWQIEVFIKFLKQHLNLSHIVSRNENGLKVMLYMTLILALLIIVFKKLNRIDSYKIAKLRFEIELDNSLTKEIVILCGGNPDKAPHLWNSG
jgi:hypothetical protein